MNTDCIRTLAEMVSTRTGVDAHLYAPEVFDRVVASCEQLFAAFAPWSPDSNELAGALEEFFEAAYNLDYGDEPSEALESFIQDQLGELFPDGILETEQERVARLGITSDDIAELRRRTGEYGPTCRKVLIETQGDIEQAVVILRRRGQAIYTPPYSDNQVLIPPVLISAEPTYHDTLEGATAMALLASRAETQGREFNAAALGNRYYVEVVDADGVVLGKL